MRLVVSCVTTSVEVRPVESCEAFHQAVLNETFLQ